MFVSNDFFNEYFIDRLSDVIKLLLMRFARKFQRNIHSWIYSTARYISRFHIRQVALTTSAHCSSTDISIFPFNLLLFYLFCIASIWFCLINDPFINNKCKRRDRRQGKCYNYPDQLHYVRHMWHLVMTNTIVTIA